MARRSQAEAELGFHLANSATFFFTREYRWHPTRKWRSDFAIWRGEPTGEMPRLLVEIEGVRWDKPGRHQRAEGMEKDCEKYAEALLAGYRVLRVTPRMVRDGRALQFIERAMIK